MITNKKIDCTKDRKFILVGSNTKVLKDNENIFTLQSIN